MVRDKHATGWIRYDTDKRRRTCAIMPKLLIRAEELAHLLAAQHEPPSSPTITDAHAASASWRVIDCRSQLQDSLWGRRQYLAGHIPGALHAHLERDLSGPIRPGQTGRHPLPDPAVLAATFSRFGIDPETRVVAYDDAGGVYASRLWWLLRWLGHDHCLLLDGGLLAWCAAGLPLQTGDESVEPSPFIGSLRAGMTVTAASLQQPDPMRVIIDVRGPARYAGREEPIDPIAGHIPGAINLPFAGNLDAGGRFLPAEALRARYAAVGDQAVSYCGSGVTACHAIFAMTLAHLPPARLYPGSWSEWITDPSRPIATGEQP